jgi:hypothetical protein
MEAKHLRNGSAHGEVLRCPVQGLYHTTSMGKIYFQTFFSESETGNPPNTKPFTTTHITVRNTDILNHNFFFTESETGNPICYYLHNSLSYLTFILCLFFKSLWEIDF